MSDSPGPGSSRLAEVRQHFLLGLVRPSPRPWQLAASHRAAAAAVVAVVAAAFDPVGAASAAPGPAVAVEAGRPSFRQERSSSASASWHRVPSAETGCTAAASRPAAAVVVVVRRRQTTGPSRAASRAAVPCSCRQGSSDRPVAPGSETSAAGPGPSSGRPSAGCPSCPRARPDRASRRRSSSVAASPPPAPRRIWGKGTVVQSLDLGL